MHSCMTMMLNLFSESHSFLRTDVNTCFYDFINSLIILNVMVTRIMLTVYIRTGIFLGI